MAVDELDLLADDQVRHRDRLLRIAGVVLDHDLDLLAVDAAGLVDRGGGGFGAALHLVADRGERAGHRTGDGDDEVVGQGGGGERRERDPRQRQNDNVAHDWLLPGKGAAFWRASGAATASPSRGNA